MSASISRVVISFRSGSVGFRSEEVSQSSTTYLSSLFDNKYHSNWSFACHFDLIRNRGFSGELLFFGLLLVLVCVSIFVELLCVVK